MSEKKQVAASGLNDRLALRESVVINVQEAIDIAVREDRRITFQCYDGREVMIAAIADRKWCALIKPALDATEITVWPPSQCTVLQNQGKTQILPTCLL